MTRAVRAVVPLLLAAAPMRAQAPADSVPLAYAASMSIEQVIDATVRHSPPVAQAAGAVSTGVSGERVAVGTFLPSLTLVSQAYQSNQTLGAVSTGAYSPQNYAVGFGGSIDLFTGGRRGALVSAAHATTRSADASLIAERYATRLTAQTAFYAAQHGHEIVVVGHTTVANATRALQYVTSMLRAGTATKADLLLAQYNLTLAQQQLISAQDTLATATYALGRLVGIDGAVDVTGSDSLPSPTLAVTDSDLLSLASHDAPAVRAADQYATATHEQTRATRTEYIPTISLSGGYDWANESNFVGAIRPGFFVGIGTSFPLFNGFVREDDVERAVVAERVARVQEADTHRLARAEAAQFLAAVRSTWAVVAQATEAVRVTTEGVRVQDVQYQAGVTTFLDLSTAQLNAAQAGETLAFARQSYLLARASLEALVGRSL